MLLGVALPAGRPPGGEQELEGAVKAVAGAGGGVHPGFARARGDRPVAPRGGQPVVRDGPAVGVGAPPGAYAGGLAVGGPVAAAGAGAVAQVGAELAAVLAHGPVVSEQPLEGLVGDGAAVAVGAVGPGLPVGRLGGGDGGGGCGEGDDGGDQRDGVLLEQPALVGWRCGGRRQRRSIQTCRAVPLVAAPYASSRTTAPWGSGGRGSSYSGASSWGTGRRRFSEPFPPPPGCLLLGNGLGLGRYVAGPGPGLIDVDGPSAIASLGGSG